MRSFLRYMLIVFVVACISTEMSQASILIRETAYVLPSPSPPPFGYNGSTWSSTTAAINVATGNQVMVATDFLNAAQVNAADALWIDIGNIGAGPGSTLLPGEVANITNFINTGRRVVMFGNNDDWSIWNNSILSIVGSAASAPNSSGVLSTQVSHPLTAGVSSVDIISGGHEIGLATGMQLFDQNLATLWSSNVLTILDTNMFEEDFLGTLDNRQFRDNVVNWVTASNVPEPSSLLVWSMLGVVGLKRRRHKA